MFEPGLQIAPGRKIGQKPEARGGAGEDRPCIPAGFHQGVDLAVADDVTAIISRSLKIPVEQLTPDKRLDELGAESLDVIEIIFELEEKFDIGITVRANELAPSKTKDGGTSDAQFTTIGDLTAEVERLVAAKAAQ